MNRPNEPHMHDPADKELHRKEGVDPYPVPERAAKAGQPDSDVEDPAEIDRRAPHDRGQARDGGYTTGVDAMKKKLKNEGETEEWKDGRTQNAPPKH